MKSFIRNGLEFFNIHRTTSRSSQKGMTLIEIMIVITILVGLIAVLARNFGGAAEQAKVDQTKIIQGNLGQALQLYKVHNNKFPSTQEGLEALVSNPGDSPRWRGPYTEKDKLQDAWGQAFDYQSDGRKFKITSGGLDQTIGTGDDIVYPEESAPAAPQGSQGSSEESSN